MDDLKQFIKENLLDDFEGSDLYVKALHLAQQIPNKINQAKGCGRAH